MVQSDLMKEFVLDLYTDQAHKFTLKETMIDLFYVLIERDFNLANELVEELEDILEEDCHECGNSWDEELVDHDPEYDDIEVNRGHFVTNFS